MIYLENINKTFKFHTRGSGIRESISSIFNRKYQYKKVLHDISFNIKEGEIVGLIGPNGAGKTTLMKILSGIIFPDEGLIKINNHYPFQKKHEYLKTISVVMGQKQQLNWDLTAKDSFEVNRVIYNITDYEDKLEELISLLNAENIVDKQVRKLSLGERMKCELIASLLHSPKILFLDEPTIGLDFQSQRTVRNFLKEYNKKHNITVLITSHYLDDITDITDKIMIISGGKIKFKGNLSELKKDNLKKINVIFSETINLNLTEHILKNIHKDDYSYTLLVNSDNQNSVVSELFKQYGNFILDIKIEEEDISNLIERHY